MRWLNRIEFQGTLYKVNTIIMNQDGSSSFSIEYNKELVSIHESYITAREYVELEKVTNVVPISFTGRIVEEENE